MHWFHIGLKYNIDDNNLIKSKSLKCFGKNKFQINEIKNMLIDLYPDSAVKLMISRVEGKTTVLYDLDDNVSYRVWTSDYNKNANKYIQVSIGFDDKYSIVCKLCEAEKTAFINSNHLSIVYDKLKKDQSCF
jgi:hypothetical protein